MTKINKILMRGFKSFANRTELLFGDQFNCILGPNGSGKCVVGSTLVQLSDGRNVRIKDLVEEKIREGAQRIDDGFIAYADDEEILCLNTETLKVEPRNIQAFVKRESPEQLLEIRTRSGRQITATEYHPLFVLDNDKIRSIKAGELKEGIKVAVPRELSLGIKTKTFYELLDIIGIEDNIYVPFNKIFKDILLDMKKGREYKALAEDIGVPFNVLKGINDSQSVNFTHLVKIMRYSGMDDDEIIALIPKIKGKTSSVEYIMPWENSSALSRFLGYLLAEGRLTDNNQIWFTNGDEEIVKDYYRLITGIFGLRATINEYKPECWDVLAYASPVITILSKFGISGGAKGKDIPSIFMSHAETEEIAQILNGMYCGDGYVSHNTIEIVTKSEKLAFAIETCLLRLGIGSSSKYIVKKATNSGFEGIYKSVCIYGVENHERFHECITLVHPAKQERLKRLIGKKSNPNLDLLEVNSLVKRVSNELGIKIKPSKKEFPRLDSYCYDQCTPSRPGIKHLLKNLFLPKSVEMNTATQSLVALQLLSDSDIYWDEIVSIEKIESKEKWVYDLCVDKHHNFIANNLFVHNSNVLDALCFVLGKSSARSLRAEKAANLVYNGGKKNKPAKEGEVSIFFDNSKQTFPTEDRQVKVTRIVKDDGQSIYRINDKRRTRQEILELLSVAKIDPNGYNIILQGDIVRFVEMHPVQRRNIIEEIAGISIYEEKKNSALRELDRVQDKLNESEIILTERNSYLKELKKERDQALRYQEMADKIKQNKASYLKIQIDSKNTKKESMQKQVDDHNAKREKLDKGIDELKSSNRGLKEEIEDISKEVEKRGDISLNKEIESIKIEIAKNKSRVDTLQSEIERINKKRDDIKKTIKDAEGSISEAKGQIKKKGQDLDAMIKSKTSIEQKISEFKKKNNLDGADDIEKEIDSLDKNIEEKQKRIQVLREDQQNLIREQDKATFQIQTLDERISKVLEIEKEHKEQIDNLKNMKKRFKAVTLELNKSLDEDSTLSARLGESRKRLLEANENLAKLKARTAGIQQGISEDLAIRSIMKDKSRFKGVHGTVSDLGNVSSKYALALETAAGPRLKSIVVDNDKVAADCIKYLKINRLGTAAFLPMNKLKVKPADPKVKSLAKSNGVAGLAIDLVDFDLKLKKAFDYIFANTLVVDSIDVARRLGVGSAKMVTLDGDMAELSGVMHGGYRKAKKTGYGFKEKELTKDTESTEARISELQGAISALESKRASNEGDISRLREEKAHLEGDIIRMEKSLHLDSGDMDATKNKKVEYEKELAQLTARIDHLVSTISKENRELADCKIRKQQLRSQVNDLRNPVKLAELNTFEQKRAELSEASIRLESEIRNLQMQVDKMFGREKESSAKILQDIDTEEESFRKEIKELESVIAKDSKELKAKEKKAEEFYSQFKALFQKRTQIQDSISKNEVEIDRRLSASREVEQKANMISLQLAQVNAELSSLEKEFEQYHGIKLFTDKSEEQLKNEIRKFERMVDDIGSVNMKALEIYDNVEAEYNRLLEKKDKLMLEKEDVIAMMEEIESKKKELFMSNFDIVNGHFKDIFLKLSTKGEASLELENDENPFEGGLNVKVRLSGNKFMDIRSLSGGEKTMTALAFIFAIQEHNPATFYVLDEVDAALDKKNSEKLAKLVSRYSERSQYVIISHNDGIISEAQNLYGVSMNEHGISQVVSLRI